MLKPAPMLRRKNKKEMTEKHYLPLQSLRVEKLYFYLAFHLLLFIDHSICNQITKGTKNVKRRRLQPRFSEFIRTKGNRILAYIWKQTARRAKKINKP